MVRASFPNTRIKWNRRSNNIKCYNSLNNYAYYYLLFLFFFWIIIVSNYKCSIKGWIDDGWLKLNDVDVGAVESKGSDFGVLCSRRGRHRHRSELSIVYWCYWKLYRHQACIKNVTSLYSLNAIVICMYLLWSTLLKSSFFHLFLAAEHDFTAKKIHSRKKCHAILNDGDLLCILRHRNNRNILLFFRWLEYEKLAKKKSNQARFWFLFSP